MLHLVYRIKPSPAAERDPHAFWAWVRDRERWFYDGLDTVLATRWRVRTIGQDVHTLEHTVTFADEAAWGRYRRAVADRGSDPEWERRRVEQGRWWTLLDADLLSDPPVPLGITRDTPEDAAGPADRVRHLLGTGRRATLATTDGTTPWIDTVDVTVLRDPLRLLWRSPREARHSRDVATHPDVSGIVHADGSAGGGVRFTGTARDSDPLGRHVLHVARLWWSDDEQDVEVDPRALG
ncbi:pyridoxamine 5'-phosphate oxidase family protein [Umezawaea sp.]|uniref:pyridoxamine 5'-phosphate oxidase family protein n=1 Tax=Umezawaea sp. TaxID=1955258 RepID=UPI002ED5410E